MAESDNLSLRRSAARPDAEAFKEILHRYSGMVYGTCCRFLGDPTEAEDVTQECFEALVHAPSAPSPHIGPWLHRVATNLCSKRVRSDQRRRERETRFAALRSENVDIQWDDLYPIVDEAIQELPEKLRVPLIAHYLEGTSHAAVAESLRIPRRTVSNRIAKALQHLGTSLRARGITVPASTLGSLLGAGLANAAPVPDTLTGSLGKLALTLTARPLSPRPGLTAATTGLPSMKAPILGIASLAIIAVASIIFIGRDSSDVTTADHLALPDTEAIAAGTPTSPQPRETGDQELPALSKPSAGLLEEAEQEPLNSEAILAYIFDEQDLSAQLIKTYAYEADYEKIHYSYPDEEQLKAIQQGKLRGIWHDEGNGLWKMTETGLLNRIQRGTYLYAMRSLRDQESEGYVVANAEYVAAYGIDNKGQGRRFPSLVSGARVYYHGDPEEPLYADARSHVDEMSLRIDPITIMFGMGPRFDESFRHFVSRIQFTKKEAWREANLYYVELDGPEPNLHRLFTIDADKGFAIVGIESGEKDGASRWERTLVLWEVGTGIWFPTSIEERVSTNFMPGQPAPSESKTSRDETLTVQLKNVSLNRTYRDQQFSVAAFADIVQNEIFSIKNLDGTKTSGIFLIDTFVTKQDTDLFHSLQGVDVDLSESELDEIIKTKANGSARIEETLRTIMGIWFPEKIAVLDFVGYLGDAYDLDIRIDEQAVAPYDAVVGTIDMRDLSMHEILDAVLARVGLDYTYVQDKDYILVTTRKAAPQ